MPVSSGLTISRGILILPKKSDVVRSALHGLFKFDFYILFVCKADIDMDNGGALGNVRQSDPSVFPQSRGEQDHSLSYLYFGAIYNTRQIYSG